MPRQIHHPRRSLRLPTAGSSLVQLACAGLLGLAACLPVQAALFGDDEARKAILELRAKVDANRQSGDSALAELRRQHQAEVDAEEAFLLRTLLIHDYRRLLLRDPELPDVLLPAEWPGQKARLLCQALYRCLIPASERHLDKLLRLADGSNPPCDSAYAERFSLDDQPGQPAR